MAVEVTYVDVIVLSIASFVGTVGIALTGFGMAILYVFAWQTAVLVGGYESDFKFAIFVQAIALTSAQPFLLRMAKIPQNFSRDMMLYFVPITVIMTPPGQILAERISTDIIKAVGGVLITVVAVFEVYQRLTDKNAPWMKWLKRSSKDEEFGSVSVDHISEEGNQQLNSSEPLAMAPPIDVESDVKLERDSVPCTDLSPEPSIGEIDSSGSQRDADEQTNESHPWPLSAKLLTLLAGGSSGFLGGLAAVRGPPIILYFLYPPKGISFSKETQRATAAAMSAANAFMRVIYYLVDTLALGGSHSFRREDWYLYVSVIVSAILGVQLGAWLFELTKDSKTTIRAVLTLLLLFCGISLLLSSFTNV